MKSKTLVLIILTIFLLTFATSYDEEVTFTADQQWEVPDNVQEVDVFLVGGGGGSDDRQGSGGGYTETYEDVDVSPETTIDIQIGSGGSSGQDGEPSQFMNSNYQADGGEAPRPGDGGSGGGARGSGFGCHTTGGSDGGEDGSDGDDNSGGSTNEGGSGQGTTTRAFEDPDGTLYAGGGGGGSCDRSTGSGGAGGGGDAGSSGSPNTGGGGGEDSSGGSGIVKVRYEESFFPPDNPSNPSPSSNEDTVSLDTELEVDVSGDDLDYVEFEIDGQTYTDSSVVNGGTASTADDGGLHELDAGETYSWSAEVCNDAGCNSDSWSFTTVHEPDEPSLVSPSPDGVTDVSTGSDLEVDVSHPDGLDMDVSFRIDDGSGWSDVDSESNVADDATVSVNPDLELSEDYDWYAEASAEGLTTQSDTWSFSTEHDVSVSHTGYEADPVPLDTDLEVELSHSDPTRTVDVDLILDGEYEDTIVDVSDGDVAGFDVDLDPGENYDWYVEVDGEEGSETFTSQTWSFETVEQPEVNLVSPGDGEDSVNLDTDLEVDTVQDDDLDLSTTIEVYDEEGNFIDDFSEVHSPGDVIFTDPNLELSENYEWEASTVVDSSAYEVGDDSERWSFSTEHDIGAEVGNPGDEDDVVGVEAELEAEVSHSDDERESIVTFFDSQGNDLGTDSGVQDGEVASLDTSEISFGSQTGTEYEWYVTVDDGESDSDVYTSDTWSFTTIHEPATPSDGVPQGDEITLNSPFEVDVSQADGEQMNVEFYLNDTLEETIISSPGRAEVPGGEIDLDEGTNYEWYAEATLIDEHQVEHSAQSPTWDFETVHEPDVLSVDPEDGGEDVRLDTDLELDIEQEDGRDLNYEIFDADTDGQIGSETGVEPGEVTVFTDQQDFASEPGQTYNWYAVVEEPDEGLEFSNEADPWSFTTVENPEQPVDPIPEDGADEADVNLTLSVFVDHDDVDEVDVLFFNEETGNELGRDEGVEAGSRAELSIDEDFKEGLDDEDQSFGTEFDEEYEWYVVSVAGGATTESNVFEYETVRPGNVIIEPETGTGNMDPSTAQSGTDILRVNLEHDMGEELDEAIFTDSDTGDEIFVSENVTSGESASFNITAEWPGEVEEDESYEWDLEVRNKGYTIGELSSSFTTYTNYLSWDESISGNEDHYRVYHSTEDGDFDFGDNSYAEVAIPSQNEFVDANTDISTGLNCYRVVSVNIGGESEPVPLDQGECINVN